MLSLGSGAICEEREKVNRLSSKVKACRSKTRSAWGVHVCPGKTKSLEMLSLGDIK